jgi:hypothetical protein
MWRLIPGIGKQGGVIKDTVQSSFTGAGSIAVNVSSGVCLASSENDFDNETWNAASSFRNQFRKASADCD